ncbi:DHH family phosphoesterase [Nosocomiicoccus ampullae]|uniref:Phosphoesterase RecJ-like protein n=1 Tax=Nosocomiicoccus ampullae TaxID=489910 RepID=A0A9Q2HE91_9STAP|nr:bifunctional oligoribonuclease/PAP phosphatase NrnA [Nosocomiicoccus ampullae]MBB5175284.1 phosphoesterase RecJ-like protein [Nosocomiicoccus ampullae]QYA46341.1 bifunctional oligoribonuclease/PAP phosphatase NrnA [Nosocomiicoccus ampullae]
MFNQFLEQLRSLNEYKDNVFKQIEAAESIVILRHIRPDPDALGSQLSLKQYLKNKYPEKEIRALGVYENELKFMGELDDGEITEKDLVIVLDTANVERIDYDGDFTVGKGVIKIDHHPNIEPYGDINIVEPSVSSTSELIYILLSLVDSHSIDKTVRSLVYLGIIGDTGRFLYNSHPSTYEVMSDIARGEVDTNGLLMKLYKKSLEDFKFSGFLINNFNLTDKGVLSVYVSEKDREDYGVDETAAALQVNLFRDVEDVKVWFMALESGDEIRVRLRSKDVEINDVAAHFGGGGHPHASGIRFRRKEDLNKLIEKLEEKL